MKMSWKNATRNRVVEAGTYLIRVKDWKSYTSQNGNECIIFEHEVIGPDTCNEMGHKISDFLALTDNSQWRLGWFVGTCGINITELPDMDTGTEEFKRVLNACKGRVLWVSVSKEIYDGKDVNKINDYMPEETQEEVQLTQEVPDFIKKKVLKKDDDQKIPF